MQFCNVATFHCLHSFKAFIRTIALLWNNPISLRFCPQDTTYRSNPNRLHLKGPLKSGADVHRLACDWVFPGLCWSCDAKLEAKIKKGSEAGEVLTQVSSPLHCHQRRSPSACTLCPAWSLTYPGLQEDDKPDSRQLANTAATAERTSHPHPDRFSWAKSEHLARKLLLSITVTNP